MPAPLRPIPRAPTAQTAHDLRQRFGSEPFRVAQAAAAGVSRGRLRAVVAAGRILRLRRGMLLVPGCESGCDGGCESGCAPGCGDGRDVADP